ALEKTTTETQRTQRFSYKDYFSGKAAPTFTVLKTRSLAIRRRFADSVRHTSARAETIARFLWSVEPHPAGHPRHYCRQSTSATRVALLRLCPSPRSLADREITRRVY